MPNIIKNGINYAGSPAEMVTAWDDETAPDIPEYSLENLTGSMATIETSPTTHAYSAGDYLVWESRLYKVTASISVGGTLVVGTNIESTDVGSELSSLNSNKDFPLTTGDHVSMYLNKSKYINDHTVHILCRVQVTGTVYNTSIVEWTTNALNTGLVIPIFGGTDEWNPPNLIQYGYLYQQGILGMVDSNISYITIDTIIHI